MQTIDFNKLRDNYINRTDIKTTNKDVAYYLIINEQVVKSPYGRIYYIAHPDKLYRLDISNRIKSLLIPALVNDADIKNIISYIPTMDGGIIYGYNFAKCIESDKRDYQMNMWINHHLLYLQELREHYDFIM